MFCLDPTYQWLLLYNWYRNLNSVVKWNGCYSKTFDITRGTRQWSKRSPYLFNIFIDRLLLDLNDYYAGIRIGDGLYNAKAYADDITIVSTNAKCLQCLGALLICVQCTDGDLNMASRNRNVWSSENILSRVSQCGVWMMSVCVMLNQWKSLAMCSMARGITPVMLTTG